MAVNNLTMHHYDDGSAQLVPTPVNKHIHHTGGRAAANKLRPGKE